MIQKSYLAEKIKIEYDFNEYSLEPEKCKEIAEIIYSEIQRRKVQKLIIEQFFDELHRGLLGTFYRQPVSFLSKFNEFIKEKQAPQMPSRKEYKPEN